MVVEWTAANILVHIGDYDQLYGTAVRLVLAVWWQPRGWGLPAGEQFTDAAGQDKRTLPKGGFFGYLLDGWFIVLFGCGQEGEAAGRQGIGEFFMPFPAVWPLQ